MFCFAVDAVVRLWFLTTSCSQTLAFMHAEAGKKRSALELFRVVSPLVFNDD
jgi:hypothetical protein